MIPTDAVFIRNNPDVYVLDNTSQSVKYYASKAAGAPMTLGVNTVVGSYTLTMSTGHTFTANDEIFIASVNRVFYAIVLSVATNVLTLDRPIDYVFSTTSTIVLEVTTNMNVNGSVTPQIFSIETSALSTDIIHINGYRLSMLDGSAMDDSTFGGITALTRGLVFRKISADGSHFVYWSAKTNGELSLLIDNMQYSSKAPTGKYGVSFESKLLESNGVSIELLPGEELQAIVQDDLTGLDSIKVLFYGHILKQ